jgi:hypothetical protein
MKIDKNNDGEITEEELKNHIRFMQVWRRTGTGEECNGEVYYRRDL